MGDAENILNEPEQQELAYCRGVQKKKKIELVRFWSVQTVSVQT